MRVPRVGSVYTPVVSKKNAVKHFKKLTDPPAPSQDKECKVGFGTSVAYYLKKYNTLPPDIQSNLSPKDAVDMFKDMEFVADGRIRGKRVGQGSKSSVYENPWLDGYYFIVLNNPDDVSLKKETIYTSVEHLGDAVWCDKDDRRIQLISS